MHDGRQLYFLEPDLDSGSFLGRTMSERCAIFIDGGYLIRVLNDEFNFKVDYQKFSNILAGNNPLLRTYFYNCLPFQSNPPTPEESERFAKAQKFYDAIKKIPNYEVRYGKLSRRGKPGEYYYEQKMIDTLLSIDLVSLSAKHVIQRALLITGDSDFIPAISLAKNEGVHITLIHGQRPHADLIAVCDENIRIDAEMLKQARL